MPARELEMAHRARRGVFCGSASALMLLLLADVAAAQKSQILKNLELCNGVNRTSPDIQIDGCTALINSGAQTPRTRVIAYNNRGNAYMAKGETYLNKGDYERALLDFDEATRLKPTLGAVWNGRCWARAIVGELQAALADCYEALRLEPNVAVTLDSRGLTYLKMGQWDSAIDDYSSALRSDPKLASSLYGRGLAKLKKGDTTGGDADIAAAKSIEVNIVEEFARYGVE
jgi:tetratricopeptide (TPR) repeat protein